MTCDGKVMTLTERECGGIELACGGDPNDSYLARPWNVGAVWLGMTYETAYRWRSGQEDEPHTGKYAKTIERQKRAARERWYA